MSAPFPPTFFLLQFRVHIQLFSPPNQLEISQAGQMTCHQKILKPPKKNCANARSNKNGTGADVLIKFEIVVLCLL